MSSPSSRLQFSLRVLLLGIGLISIPLAIYGRYLHLQRQRLKAIAQIQSDAGSITFRDRDAIVYPEPSDDTGKLQFRIDAIYLASSRLEPQTLALLPVLTEVRFISFNSSPLTDGDIRVLDGLPVLRELQLNGTQVTDEGVRHLAARHRLTQLSLNNTGVTDDVVEVLGTMKSLRKVNLWDTRLSVEAINRLKKMLPECEVVYSQKVADGTLDVGQEM